MEIICNQCRLVNQYEVKVNGPHVTAYCSKCGGYIKNLPQLQEPKMYVGKYKGWLIKDIQERDYLEWALLNIDSLKENQRKAIREQLQSIDYNCK